MFTEGGFSRFPRVGLLGTIKEVVDLHSKSNASFQIRLFSLIAMVSATIFSSISCNSTGGTDSTTKASGASCPTLTGTSWTPSIAGAGSSNHDSGVSITSQSFDITGKRVTAVDQSFSSATAIYTVNFTVATAYEGSLALQAELRNLHPTLRANGGYGWPALISLTNDNALVGADWVKLKSTCQNTSMFSDSNFTYTAGCGINSASGLSAFLGTTDALATTSWELTNGIGYAGQEYSQAVFPTCNWSSGSPSCPFVANTFLDSSGKIPAGNYTAKFIVIANFPISQLGSSHNYTADLHVTVKQKTQVTDTSAKAIDLNVVLVGSTNVQASRTARGKKNLDLLISGLQSHYSSASALNVKLGTITVYEWGCDAGGDAYNSGMAIADLTSFLKTGSSLVASSSSGSAINVFLVPRITGGSGGGYTIVGVSGGIPGALVHGTGASGLVFSTYFSASEALDTFNSSTCTVSGACPIASQNPDFVEMQATIAHEIGHYLGLRHPSESAGTTHDPVPDTPTCTTTSAGKIVPSSCATEASCSTPCTTEIGGAHAYNGTTYFCPTTTECQFNHLMFWRTKNYNSSDPSIRDGDLISSESGQIMRYNPYVH